MKGYLYIQMIGFVGTLLFFLSFQCRSTKNLFRIQFLSYLFYTVHLFLLGAVTGGISYTINTLRSLCLGSSWKFGKSKAMCVIICSMQIAALIITWNGWISLLPIAANIAATIGAYSNNGKTIRIVGMTINSPLWIIYNVIVGSWAGILDEVVSEVSMGISIARYGWKNLENTQS